MSILRSRIEKLERSRPQGLDHLSDEDLNALFMALHNKPEIQSWLADDTNTDPERLQALEFIKSLVADGVLPAIPEI